jgi:hypothetical protein
MLRNGYSVWNVEKRFNIYIPQTDTLSSAPLVHSLIPLQVSFPDTHSNGCSEQINISSEVHDPPLTLADTLFPPTQATVNKKIFFYTL